MSGGIDADRRRGAAVEPHRDHRLRRRRAWRSCGVLLNRDAARPVRARRHAEPRRWRAALGVPHRRASTCCAFGLGSGIAGLAGCALSQIGNVGPDLGQSYIVDSFMVVVLGGVGQLAGTVVRRARAGRRQQVPRGVVGRGAGQDRRARLHHRLHPEAPAGPVRAQGPDGRRMRHGHARRRIDAGIGAPAASRGSRSDGAGLSRACGRRCPRRRARCSRARLDRVRRRADRGPVLLPAANLRCRRAIRCTSPTTSSRWPARSCATRSSRWRWT